MYFCGCKLFIKSDYDMEMTVETASVPNDVLTWQQIKDKVGDGWAIISNPEFDGLNFVKGELFHYGYNKSEVYQRETRGQKDVLFRYCGKRDHNVYLMLVDNLTNASSQNNI